MASRERLSLLLQAVVGIGSDLDLHSTLSRIVVAACQVADARYGALAVVGPDRSPVQFISDGLTATERHDGGELPTGRGVVGLLGDGPRAARVDDIAVPVQIRDRVYGNLFLTDKRGGGGFSQGDEEIVLALAVAAGIAIDNARLYAAAGRRQRWLEATAEITNTLVGKVDRANVLRLVADHARTVADAALVAILLYDETTDELQVEVTAPHLPDLVRAAIPLAGTPFQRVIAGGAHILVDDLDAVAGWPSTAPAGPTLLAPLAMTGTVQGVLVVGLSPGSAGFDGDADVNMITTFAAQAALAVERARAQEERELLMVLADRERIARDLHDVVIQRLFATGLGLQGLTHRTRRDDIRERLEQAIDELDTTIREIRTAIFGLHGGATDSVRAALVAAVDDAAQMLGFRPRLTVTGPIDLSLTATLRSDLIAVVGEALSNVVKHARAAHVEIDVSVGAGRLTLLIADDGVGAGEPGNGEGMLNLRARAEDRGGTFTVGDADPHGLVLTWSVALDS